MIATVDLTASSQRALPRIFPARECIPSSPDLLWRIEEGIVRTQTWNEAGRLCSLGFWGPGDLIGQPLSQIEPYEMECLASVAARPLMPADWPDAIAAILSHARQTEAFLSVMHYPKLEDRLWHLLLWLAKKFSHRVHGGRLIDLRLTHQDLADAIGATRVTVTRTIGAFKQAGVLHYSSRDGILLVADAIAQYPELAIKR
ncbi:MAG: Crp/Fnr family transcriptional regulator [Cyanobacteria bacterium J06639_1]